MLWKARLWLPGRSVNVSAMRSFRRQDGQSAVEYLGVLVVVSTVVGLLVASPISGLFSAGVGRQICRIMQAADCGAALATGSVHSPPANGSRGSGQLSIVAGRNRAGSGDAVADRDSVEDIGVAAAEPVASSRLVSTRGEGATVEEYLASVAFGAAADGPLSSGPGSDGGRELGVLGHVDGFLTGAMSQAVDAVTGLKDLAVWGWRTATSHEQRVENALLWEAIKSDPRATALDVWRGMTEPIVEDWQAGRRGSALGRGAVEIASIVFGGKGIKQITAAARHRLPHLADDVGAIARRASQHSGMVATQAVVSKPIVESRRLQNIINDLYKGTTNPRRVGTGTTADAIRHELRTGRQVFGRTHMEKGQGYLRGLERWLRQNPGASYRDRLIAQTLADDLRDALGITR